MSYYFEQLLALQVLLRVGEILAYKIHGSCARVTTFLTLVLGHL